MTDDDYNDSNRETLYTRFLNWHKTTKAINEAAWGTLPADKKGTMIISISVPAILIGMFIPYVSFDAAGPGETNVYPMGESTALVDSSDFISPVFTILCIVFASRFSKHRTAWSYRLLWFCVFMTALNVFGVLFALWPGVFGYQLWAIEAHGAMWAYENLDSSMSNGTIDYWAKLTSSCP